MMLAGDGVLECSLTLINVCIGHEEALWPAEQEGKMLGHVRTIWRTETIKMKSKQRCNQMPDGSTCRAPSWLVFLLVVEVTVDAASNPQSESLLWHCYSRPLMHLIEA